MSQDASTPLYVASWKGHGDVVRRLLTAGAQADRYHRDRATPLFVAAQEGHSAVVSVLLTAGADSRRKWQDMRGRRWSAVDKAIANGHSDVVTLLRGAMKSPKHGHSALHRQGRLSGRTSPGVSQTAATERRRQAPRMPRRRAQ